MIKCGHNCSQIQLLADRGLQLQNFHHLGFVRYKPSTVGFRALQVSTNGFSPASSNLVPQVFDRWL
jgi:hypothetical protein